MDDTASSNHVPTSQTLSQDCNHHVKWYSVPQVLSFLSHDCRMIITSMKCHVTHLITWLSCDNNLYEMSYDSHLISHIICILFCQIFLFHCIIAFKTVFFYPGNSTTAFVNTLRLQFCIWIYVYSVVVTETQDMQNT